MSSSQPRSAEGRSCSRLSVADSTAPAASAQIPTTPPGRHFSSWLSAVNAADRAAMQTFIDASKANFTVDQAMGTATRTGGLDIKKVESSSDTSLVVLVQERGPTKQFINVAVSVPRTTPDRVAGSTCALSNHPPNMRRGS